MVLFFLIMLKKEIVYKDFNGNQATDVFYFHLSKQELIELELGTSGGYSNIIEGAAEAKDVSELIKMWKGIILKAYGKKSPDGKIFEKSEELIKEFSQSAAFDQLYWELSTDSDAAANFVRGCLPDGFEAELKQQMAEALGTDKGEPKLDVVKD